MATVVASNAGSVSTLKDRRSASPPTPYFLPLLLTPLTLVVHGYHPFAGDAGIYTAGVRHILQPSLYPLNAAFVTPFTQRSVFPWMLAGIVRLTHLPLAWILLAAHLASLWLFLVAAGGLAARVLTRTAQSFAILLAAACCALPVAGTALVLMDPYVTARSFSTPIGLLAVAAALDRRWTRAALLVLLAIAVHPLMGAYAGGFVLLLSLITLGRLRLALLLCGGALLLAGIAFAAARLAPVDPAYREALSLAPRSFLFLARWRWYEVLGLVLPLGLFAVALRRCDARNPVGALCLTSILVGSTALPIAACFVPAAGPWLLVPFQVLRSFQPIYCIGIVLCGGVLANLARRARWFSPVLLVVLLAVMFQVERLEWPGGNRVELPGRQPANPYVQAFFWIRANTPHDAVFAFNPQLDYRPGEDEQGFRAISERDQLPDDKDAGVAAVIPSLASRWAAQRNAVFSIDRMSDAERRASLSPLGVTWLLLPPTASTGLRCPYRSQAVQVCRLTP